MPKPSEYDSTIYAAQLTQRDPPSGMMGMDEAPLLLPTTSRARQAWRAWILAVFAAALLLMFAAGMLGSLAAGVKALVGLAFVLALVLALYFAQAAARASD